MTAKLLEQIELEAKRTNTKVKIMCEGSVEDQACVVVDAMLAGYLLRYREPYTGHLISPEEPDKIFIVQRPVMEFLQDLGVIGFITEQ
jgi:hypothetical protein